MSFEHPPTTTSIAPLLKRLAEDHESITPAEIILVIDHIFNNQLSDVQIAAFLTALHIQRLDIRPEIIAAAAEGMRGNGVKIEGLDKIGGGRKEGSYEGGLVDIVGTGGDGHNTFNVSTTSAILASSYLRIAKHGNKASTSASGSADILMALGAKLEQVTPDKVARHFTTSATNAEEEKFAFLYAPVYHPSMRYVAPIRRSLGFRTVFNLLGPLVNPVDYSLVGGLEARIIGVSKASHGPIFAETLRILGAKKAAVVCGREGLDEISCEGETDLWLLKNGEIKHLVLHPTKSFGLATHTLASVAGGKSPQENKVILEDLLNNRLPDGDPILDFVLINTAALFVVAGLFDDGRDELAEGEAPSTDERWRLGVERAREGIRSGKGWKAWERYVAMSQE